MVSVTRISQIASSPPPNHCVMCIFQWPENSLMCSLAPPAVLNTDSPYIAECDTIYYGIALSKKNYGIAGLFPIKWTESNHAKLANQCRESAYYPLPLERAKSTAPHDEQIGLEICRHLADLLLRIPNHHIRLHLHLQEDHPNHQTRRLEIKIVEQLSAQMWFPLHSSRSKS